MVTPWHKSKNIQASIIGAVIVGVFSVIVAIITKCSFSVHQESEGNASPNLSSSGDSSPIVNTHGGSLIVTTGSESPVVATEGHSSPAIVTSGSNNQVIVNYYIMEDGVSVTGQFTQPNTLVKPVIDSRPYLKPSLVVSEVTETNIVFHFKILNNSRFSAQEIDCVYSTPTVRGSQMGGIHPFKIEPNQAMDLKDQGLVLRIPKIPSVLPITLHCAFRVKDAEGDRYIQEHFGFGIFTGNLLPAEYSHLGPVKLAEGQFDLGQKFELLAVEDAFESSTGLMYFWFRSQYTDPNRLSIFFHMRSRTLFYDPQKEEVVYRTVQDDEPDLYLRQKYKIVDGIWTFFAVGWKPDGGLLAIDMNVVEK